MDWIIVFYIFCVLVSIITFGSYFVLYKMRRSLLKALPRILQLHFTFTILPFTFLTTVLSFFHAIVFIVQQSNTTAAYETIRFMLVMTTQMMRIGYILIIIERILATVYLERYKHFASGKYGFLIFTLFSYITTTLYIIPSLSWIVSPVLRVIYSAMLYVIFGMHIFAMIGCRVLYLKNNQMYKLLAYRVTLEQRCTILNNIKVLKFLWSIILIFAIIGSLGIFSIILGVLGKFSTPYSMIHLFYNLSILVSISQKYVLMKIQNGEAENSQKQVISIVSPLGKVLPVSITIDNYFVGLQNQWK